MIKKEKKNHHWLFIIFSLCVLLIGYIYFFQISPTFVKKPNLEMPAQLDEEVSEEEIIYVLNEMDAYKLHDNPLTNEPAIIMFELTGEETFLIGIEDNSFEILDSGQPDISIKGQETEILSLLDSDNLEEEIINKYLSGKISLKILADEKTLALKGYKTLYDKFSSTNKITGEVIGLSAKPFQDSLSLFFLLFVSLILGLIIEKI